MNEVIAFAKILDKVQAQAKEFEILNISFIGGVRILLSSDNAEMLKNAKPVFIFDDKDYSVARRNKELMIRAEHNGVYLDAFVYGHKHPKLFEHYLAMARKMIDGDK